LLIYRRTHIGIFHLPVHHPDNVGCVFGNLAVFLLTFTQGAFSVFQNTDIATENDNTLAAAIGIEERDFHDIKVVQVPILIRDRFECSRGCAGFPGQIVGTLAVAESFLKNRCCEISQLKLRFTGIINPFK